jgi:hypothetical protein
MTCAELQPRKGWAMPAENVVKQYVTMIEANQHLHAVEMFYAPDAKVQENANTPLTGVKALTARKATTLANVRSVRAKCVPPILHNGDYVMLRWIYYFETGDDKLRRVEELVLQQWQGDQIIREQFFFDPAQLAKDL